MKLFKCQSGKCNIAGRKIRELREASEMSQEELAAKIQLLGHSISQKAISRIETGDRVIPDYELPYFSEIFNISIDDLLENK